MVEINVWELEAKAKEPFYDIHDFKDIFHKGGRILHGWYERKGLRIKFYYTPSWAAKQRMYWFHGWKWVPFKDDKKS